MDDSDSSKTSDTEDRFGSDRQVSICGREALTNGAPNSSAHSTVTRWTIQGSELYSIQPIRSNDLFEHNGDLGPIYKRQKFMDKKS